MAEIDSFATQLLEESKRFLEKAIETDDEIYRDALLHAALMVGFSSLEAHINAICEEFSSRPELSPHEKAMLLEQDVRLEHGEFKLTGFKMYRLDDRIAFLHRRFSGKPLDKKAAWLGALGTAINIRNKLTHPKGVHPISIDAVKNAVSAIIDAIDALYSAIYQKNFPAAIRGLQSRLIF